MQDLSTSIFAIKIKPISNQECPNTGTEGSRLNVKLTSTYSIDGGTGAGWF